MIIYVILSISQSRYGTPRISTDKRALILSALCEGSAINSICRMFKTSKPNVLRMIRETGQACEDWHNRHFRNLTIARLELDEQWAYCHTHKERMTRVEKKQHPKRGDCWLWGRNGPEVQGDRELDHGQAHQWRGAQLYGRSGEPHQRQGPDYQRPAEQLRIRDSGRIRRACDYATEGKVFQSSKVPAHEWPKYRVDPLVGVEREAIQGNPDLSTATVCHIERFS